MLLELRIRNFAVIDDLSVTLRPGLNALSGETGAGKSIVVGALSLLLGERASSEVVRAGEARAVVEGVFDVTGREDVAALLDEMGLEAEDGLLILRREVAQGGRNRAWVNGSPATAGNVGRLGARLVDLHGQHDHQTLLRRDAQRAILDAFAGATDLQAEVAEAHRTLLELRREREARQARARELESQLDFLRFQADEIAAAGLETGEDEALEAEARRLEHAEELIGEAGRAHEALYEGDDSVADRLAALRSAVEHLARIDPLWEEGAAELDQAYHLVVDVGRRLGDYAAGVEHDPERLAEVRRRLDLLFRLKRKYGPTLADVIATGERLAAEVREAEGAEVDLADLDRALAEAEARARERAGALSEARSAAAARLGEAVEALLPDLGLEGGRFLARLEPADELRAYGMENVEFLVSLNEGFEPRPLSRVASGGELSRVMLALKTVLADVDRVPTLVFDEIDAGIGGEVAVRVAERLRDVAHRHQVFVVTHLPQIASRADHHLLVRKGASGGATMTTVAALDGEERVEEVARMLGGDPASQASREHARELLAAADGR